MLSEVTSAGILPVVISFAIALASLLNYLAIRADIDPVWRLLFIVEAVASQHILYIVLGVFASITDLAALSLKRKKAETTGGPTRYFKRVLRSLRVQKTWVGPFVPVNRDLQLLVIFLVINYTATLLIAF
jgi:hypothetical protein